MGRESLKPPIFALLAACCAVAPASAQNYPTKSVRLIVPYPPGLITKWNRELSRILKLPDIEQRLRQLGSEAVGNSPEEFAKFVKVGSAKYAKAIRDSGTKVD